MKSYQTVFVLFIGTMGIGAVHAQGGNAFSQGFKLGSDAYDAAQRQKREDSSGRANAVRETRDAVERQQSEARTNEVDAAFAALKELYSREKKASELEEIDALFRVAFAKQDTDLMVSLQKRKREAIYSESFKKALSEWTAMHADEREVFIDKISRDARIKSLGRWVKIPGKSECLGQYVPDAADEIVRLSSSVAGQLYAYQKLQDVDASRANESASNLVKDARDWNRTIFEAQLAEAKLCVAASPTPTLRR